MEHSACPADSSTARGIAAIVSIVIGAAGVIFVAYLKNLFGLASILAGNYAPLVIAAYNLKSCER